MIEPSTVPVELRALGEDLRTPLRESLESGKPLVVTLGGEPQIVIESIEDLEVVQSLLDGIAEGDAHGR